MSIDAFQHVLNEALPLCRTISLHVQGEPLLHPDFEAILSVCDNAKAQVHLVTNGTFLCNYPNLLSHDSLYKISVSLQSASFQNKEFLSTYMDTILAAAEQVSCRTRPFLELRFWRSDQLAQDADSFCMERIKNRYSFQPTARKNNWQIADHVFVSQENDFEWPEISGNKGNAKGTCFGTRNQIGILSDLTVVPCCLDADGNIPLGNLGETSLQEILSGSRFIAMREGFQNGIIEEPFCRTCTYRYRFDR